MTQAIADNFPAPVTQTPSADTNQQPTNANAAASDNAANDAVNAQTTSQSSAATASTTTNSTEKDSDRSPFANEPYEFERCTLTVVLQFWPQDDSPQGRIVLVSARNHQDKPLLCLTREHELGVLPPVVYALLEQLRTELPERQKAYEEAAAKKRTAATTEAAHKAAAATKSQKVKASNKLTTPPSPPVVIPQPDALSRPIAPTQPVSSTEQLGLFQTEA